MLIALDLAAKPRLHILFALVVTAVPLLPQTPPAAAAPEALSPDVRSMMASIQAANLRGDLSFLASDALAGRYTPSPGLEIAAEFIASQFRAAGLEPGGGRDYFQSASMVDRKMPKMAAPITLREGDSETIVPADSITVMESAAALEIGRVPVAIAKEQTPDALKNLSISGKVVIAPVVSFESVPEADRMAVLARMRAFQKAVKASDAKALLLVGRVRRGRASLLSAEQAAKGSRVPVLGTDDAAVKKWLENPASGPAASKDRTLSLTIPAPEDQIVELKNVIGVLPGSDPKLKNTYVMLTAHYDHIGTLETGTGLSAATKPNGSDRIFNGANDDGSGTVSVIEIAKALARFTARPKRSIIFMTFFGEERGDIGSSYYGEHPAYPIAATVADLNLEQVGRTDSTEGKKINNASVTGYDYSDVTKYLERAGKLSGIKVYMEKPASDDYFVRSDNAALAEHGVPAHTLCVAFDYPDYHGLGDEWQKVDYENMARVDRMVALALLDLANSGKAPRWNRGNAKTDRFREAQAKQTP